MRKALLIGIDYYLNGNCLNGCVNDAVSMEAALELGQPELLPMERGGGSDSAYTVEIGIPTVCSMGTVGRFEHALKEESQLDSLESRARLLVESILKV